MLLSFIKQLDLSKRLLKVKLGPGKSKRIPIVKISIYFEFLALIISINAFVDIFRNSFSESTNFFYFFILLPISIYEERDEHICSQ